MNFGHSNIPTPPLGNRAICRCPAGYTGDPFVRCDADPCSQNPCGANADCQSQGNRAVCRCRQGYEVSSAPPGGYEVSSAPPGGYEVSSAPPGGYEISSAPPGIRDKLSTSCKNVPSSVLFNRRTHKILRELIIVTIMVLFLFIIFLCDPLYGSTCKLGLNLRSYMLRVSFCICYH